MKTQKHLFQLPTNTNRPKKHSANGHQQIHSGASSASTHAPVRSPSPGRGLLIGQGLGFSPKSHRTLRASWNVLELCHENGWTPACFLFQNKPTSSSTQSCSKNSHPPERTGSLLPQKIAKMLARLEVLFLHEAHRFQIMVARSLAGWDGMEQGATCSTGGKKYVSDSENLTFGSCQNHLYYSKVRGLHFCAWKN